MKIKSVAALIILFFCVYSRGEPVDPNCSSDNVLDGGYAFRFYPDGTVSFGEQGISQGATLARNKPIKMEPDGKPGLCKLKITFVTEDKNNNLDLRINLSDGSAKAYKAMVSGKALDPYYLSLYCGPLETFKAKFPSCTNSSGSGSPNIPDRSTR